MSEQQHIVVQLEQGPKEQIVAAFKNNYLAGVVLDPLLPVVEKIIILPAANNSNDSAGNNNFIEQQLIKARCNDAMGHAPPKVAG